MIQILNTVIQTTAFQNPWSSGILGEMVQKNIDVNYNFNVVLT